MIKDLLHENLKLINYNVELQINCKNLHKDYVKALGEYVECKTKNLVRSLLLEEVEKENVQLRARLGL
jgi:hypothetical protein